MMFLALQKTAQSSLNRLSEKIFIGITPDWRITCFFVDRDYRKAGVARTALEGALGFVAARGGGTVDGYPIAIPKGKKYSSSFIWGGTESMYRDLGFRPLGSFGTSNRVMVMRKIVRGR
jgi:GNAT superfamily N-acetyltransferase